MISTLLFTWIQGADFYYDLHREAVDLLPSGEGNIWIDVGCGPGLVARLAALRGYHVTGIDADQQMIQAAHRIAKRQRIATDFKTGSVFNLPIESADVVSAASLLAVLGDRTSGLNALWTCVRPGGTLLIIEPTNQMTTENAHQAIRSGLPRKRINGLRLWATARQGNVVNPTLFETLGAETATFTPLLHGLVGAWKIQKGNSLH